MRLLRPSSLLLPISVIAVFLAINVATAPRTPTVWTDEVNYSDPAVRWYLGQGFTSAAWWKQPQDQFWSGNVPGHEFLLCGWLSIFGFGVTAVRSMSYVLAAAGTALLVAAVARAGLLVSRSGRLALLLLLLTGYGITFSYRSARPDMVGLLLAGAAAFVVTLPARPRLIGLAVIGFLTPIAGLQFVVCGVVVAAFAAASIYRSALMPAVAWGVGVVAGLGGLVGLYAAHGTLAAARASIFPHTGLSRSLVAKLIENPTLYVQDWSLPIVALTGLALARRAGRWAAGCGALALLIPFALLVASRYPIYYTWMGFVPAAVAVALLLDTAGPALRRPAWVGVTAACLVGLPLRLGLAVLEYPARDYNRVEAILSAAITHDDVVFTDYAGYYPCRAKARNVYLPRYLEVIRPWEKAEVTVLVCSPDPQAVDGFTKALGGEWVPTGEAVKPLPPPSLAGPLRRFAGGASLYDLAVYRRRPAEGSP